MKLPLPASRRSLVIWIAAGTIALFALVSFVRFYNRSVELENAARAQFAQNRNAYDAFWKTVREMAQVPDRYKDDFKSILVGNTTARYGEDGSRAQVQWLREHAIQFDSTQYQRLMTAIEGGRRDFMRNQEMLLDQQRTYRNHLQSFGGRFWAALSGHPKVVLGDDAPTHDSDGDGKLTVLDWPIITSDRTEEAFAAGKDEEIQVFPDRKE